MPTFHARRVNIRLSVADLAKTITAAPLNTLCPGSTVNADNAVRQFENDAEIGTLAETPLWPDKDGCRLGFIGEHQDMPFIMVHARPAYPFRAPTSKPQKGKKNTPPLQLTTHNGNAEHADSPLTDLLSSPLSFADSIETQINRVMDDTDIQAEPLDTQALCLRVLPSTKSFLRTLDVDNTRWDVNDIKIDVYLNGDLCGSAYVPERAFHGKGYARNTLSGARNHRLTEVPWILDSPKFDVSDGALEPEQAAGQAKLRWTEISNNLSLAAEIYGRNSSNELPIVGQYLQSLAAIPMPATLPGMLKTGPKRFAVIDVVVITGKGSKDGPSAEYLFRPIPLKLCGYALSKESSPVKELELQTKQQPTAKDPSGRAKRAFADEGIVAQSCSLHHVPRMSAGKLTFGIHSREKDKAESLSDPSIYQVYRRRDKMGQSTPEFTNTPSTSAIQHSTPLGLLSLPPRRMPSTRKASEDIEANKSLAAALNASPISKNPIPAPTQRGSTTSATPTTLDVPQAKKKRIHYHDVIDARQTMAEEMEDIARQAADKEAIFFTDRRVTRAKLADVSDGVGVPTNGPLVNTTGLMTNPPVCPSAPKPIAHSNHSETRAPQEVRGRSAQKPTVTAPSSRLRHRRSLPPVNPSDSSSPEKPLILRHRAASRMTSELSHELSTPGPYAKETSISEKSPSKKAREKAHGPEPWKTPSLSKDSIVTYAGDGQQRQIRAERGGWFAEEGVLVGARFVVG